jgi:hypothetical protein
LRRLRRVRKAYAEFCAFRAELDHDPGDDGSRRRRARELAERRVLLQARMRRRRARSDDPLQAVAVS